MVVSWYAAADWLLVGAAFAAAADVMALNRVIPVSVVAQSTLRRLVFRMFVFLTI